MATALLKTDLFNEFIQKVFDKYTALDSTVNDVNKHTARLYTYLAVVFAGCAVITVMLYVLLLNRRRHTLSKWYLNSMTLLPGFCVVAALVISIYVAFHVNDRTV